jgi:hypothetical protein
MKRVLLLVVMVLMVCSPLAVSYAEDEVYWEGITPADPTITDKDFRLDFKLPAAKSLGDLEIYDQPKDIFEEEESAAPAPPVASAGPTAPVAPAEPQLRPPVQPRGLTRPPADVSPRTTGTTPRASEIIPQPAETSPGTTESIKQRRAPTRVQQSNEGGRAPAASSDELDMPGQKKMKWGQVDVKPAEPKGKFQWGQQ